MTRGAISPLSFLQFKGYEIFIKSLKKAFVYYIIFTESFYLLNCKNVFTVKSSVFLALS
jgi:hypothetical protein